LVQSEVVQVTVEHSDGLSVSPGVWTALKMRHYHSSLTQVPQLSESLLFREFLRIKTALEMLHSLNLVHMDVKSDNVFVDEDGLWCLGDFGSCRSTNSPNWTFTDVFNPYALLQFKTTVIASMDFVLLCVMIGVELEKVTWKNRLCGDSQRVQQNLVLESLLQIQNPTFRSEIITLFQQHYDMVVKHLRT